MVKLAVVAGQLRMRWLLMVQSGGKTRMGLKQWIQLQIWVGEDNMSIQWMPDDGYMMPVAFATSLFAICTGSLMLLQG